MKVVDYGKLKYLIEKSNRILVIDHHSGNGDFGDYRIIANTSPSTTTVIYNIIKELNREGFSINLSKTVLEAILTGVITDTSGFENANINKDIFKICIEALEKNIDFHYIYKEVLGNKSKNELELQKIALDRLEYQYNNRITLSYFLFSDDAYRNRAHGEHEGISNILRDIKGVDISILIREVEDGFKVGLRSKKEYDCREIAESFGGGGHFNAAGMKIYSKDLKKIKEDILNKTIEVLEKTNK